MSNYKINRNRPKLDKDAVESSKDFSSVLKQVQSASKPLYKTKWFYLSSVIGLIAISAFVFEKFINVPDKGLSEEVKEREKVVQDKIVAVKPTAGDIFTFSNQIGTELVYKTEIKLMIGPNTFADTNGNIIQGEIVLTYRELDAYAQGFSTVYDSAGVKYSLQVPKVFAIVAEDKNGNELKIVNDKAIDFIVMSDGTDTKTNLYKLNTSNGWAYISTARVLAKVSLEEEKRQYRKLTPKEEMELRAVKKEIEEAKEEMNTIEKKLPPKPQKANSKNFRFQLDVDKKDFPELAMYNKVGFEVHPSSKGFTSDMYSMQWDDVELKKIPNNNSLYSMVLTKDNVSKRFNVYPVIEPGDYESLIQKYNVANKVELGKIAELKRAIEKKEILKTEYMDLQKTIDSKKDSVWYGFSLSTFGIYNCAKPQEVLQ